MKSRRAILVAGAYGEVGRRLAAQLSADRLGPLVVAGRDGRKAAALAAALGGEAVASVLDVNEPAGTRAALRGVRLVVACTDQRAPCHLFQAVLAEGVAYVDVSANDALWRTALDAQREAERRGACVVLGSGLVPGLSNVMARAGADRLGGADTVHTAVLLSLGDEIGPAALEYMVEAVARPFEVLEEGERRRVRSFDARRVVAFPDPIGRRVAHRAPFPDQFYYPVTLGAHTAASWLALHPPWAGALVAALVRLRLGALLSRGRARRAVVRLLAHLGNAYAGQDAYALVVEVGRGRGSVRYHLVGRCEAAGTALAAASMARALYTGEVRRPGVWLAEQVVGAGPFFERLSAYGLDVRVDDPARSAGAREPALSVT